jgi:hypothetical protein
MNSWSFRRAILALVVGLGVVAGLVRGQDARTMPYANGSVPPANSPVVAAIPYAPAGVYPEVQSNQPGMLNHLNRHGLNCFATLGSLGCGSCKSECQFIFGSCRTFFGEPCLPQPPNDYGILGAQGHGILGRARGGCGCQ